MQLIPQTWRNWHTDGNADGVEDPQNLDDSVMATANYLCRASTHLETEAGWREAVLHYNQSEDYATRSRAPPSGTPRPSVGRPRTPSSSQGPQTDVVPRTRAT